MSAAGLKDRLPGLLFRAAAYGLAALAIATMALHVANAPRMSFNDYWIFLQESLQALERGDVAALARPYYEHILLLPKLVYVALEPLAKGDNRYYAWTAFAFGLAVFGVLTILSARAVGDDRSQPGRAAFAVLAAAMAVAAVAPHTIHNFILGFSGIAWFSANLLALLALWAAGSGRPAWAFLAALAATFSYGTSLALWPALALVLYCRNGSLARSAWPLAAFAVQLAVVLLAHDGIRGQMGVALDPARILYRYFAHLGAPFQMRHETGALIGAGLFAFNCYAYLYRGIFAVWRAGPGRSAMPPVWVGICLYAAFACLMISFSRFVYLDEAASRHMSVPLLYFAAAIVAAVRLFGERPAGLAAIAGAVLAAYLGGAFAVAQHYDYRRDRYVYREIGVRLASPSTDRMPNLYDRAGRPRAPFYKERGHYPFVAGYPHDCGLSGRTVDPARIKDLPAGARAAGRFVAFEGRWHGNFAKVTGWAAARGGAAIDCILFADKAGRVIGFAIGGLPNHLLAGRRQPPFHGAVWRGLVDLEGDPRTVDALVRLKGGTDFFRLPRAAVFDASVPGVLDR